MAVDPVILHCSGRFSRPFRKLHAIVGDAVSAVHAMAGSIRLSGNTFSSACAFAVALCLCLLAACAQQAPRPLLPAATLAAYEARRLDDAGLAERVAMRFPHLRGQWPPTRWNRVHLLAVALDQHPELAVARAELAAVEARARASGLREPVGLTAQVEYARRERAPWLYGLGLEIAVGDGERRRIERALADQDTLAARARLEGRAWRIRAELVQAISERIAAQASSALTVRLVELQRRRMALATQRVDAGEDDALQALPAHQDLRDAEAAADEARVQLSRTLDALAAALGLPRVAIARLDVQWDDWGTPPALDEGDALREREQALLARSDLAETIAEYAASELSLQREVARQRPGFVLAPGYAWDHGIVKLPLGFGMTLPRLDGNRAAIDAALAARELAAARLMATQASILAAIDAARVADALAAGQAQAATQRVEATREHARRQAVALQLGAVDRSETLAADLLVLEAERDALHRRHQHEIARHALEDALHAPLSGPETDLPRAATTAGDPR